MESILEFLRERITRAPASMIVLGSGQGALIEDVADAVVVPYATIPGFPRSTVAGHRGALVAGTIQGVEVLVMQGRFHLYEGRTPAEIALPIRVGAALGAEKIILTNASGGLRTDFVPGALMLISDHINLMWQSPLRGRVVMGEERFPDMSEPYAGELRRITLQVAMESGIRLEEGVYVAVSGPSYETPAEIRMLRRMGGDAVGMSTAPEVLVARAVGMEVLGISCITNLAAGLGGAELSHDEVLAVGAGATERIRTIVRGVLPKIAATNLPSEV